MKEPMTKNARKRHIQSRGCDMYDRCPYCRRNTQHGQRLDYGQFDPTEEGDIQQQITCHQCGRRWIDVFRLTEIIEIN